MVDVVLKSYVMTSASEPNFINREEFQDDIRGIKISKSPCPNGIPNRALRHLPQRTLSLLVLTFSVILLSHLFPTSVEACSNYLYT